jgi:hypothetical protein
MDPSSWVDKLKRRLGYPVVSLATPDETLKGLIQEAVERIQPYQRETEYLEGMGPVIDVSKEKVLSVVRVLPSKTMTPAVQMTDFDVFTAINISPLVPTGGSLASILARNLYRTELEAAIPKDWELRDGKVYISGYSGMVTLEVFTEKCMKKLPQVYQHWCFDYSLALLKLTEGEIRSKIKVPNAPMELNGEALKSEGAAEKLKLEERLGTELASFFATR